MESDFYRLSGTSGIAGKKKESSQSHLWSLPFSFIFYHCSIYGTAETLIILKLNAGSLRFFLPHPVPLDTSVIQAHGRVAIRR